MTYATIISRHTKADPRLVEAIMRLNYSTLDHLSDDDFRREAFIAEAMIAAEPDTCAALADSMFGSQS